MVYDIAAGETTSTQTGITNNDDTKITNTTIGKAVLIALLVLLFVSIILVIIQKIVDHRRKLY